SLTSTNAQPPAAVRLRYLFLLSFRRPPTSTLFPYTTLFRSGSRGPVAARRVRRGDRPARVLARPFRDRPDDISGRRAPRFESRRSEEHTSELQSLAYLVCRLLLEKKKPPPRWSGAQLRIALR